MTTEFDPYRKWLGIPQAELPANHYRLLGIANFEDDPDVIDNAADRSMAHVQTFKTGKHGQLTQKLLNELSAAKLCLLNPEKKLAYDASLRNQIGAMAAKPLPVATTVLPQAQALTPSQPIAQLPQSVPAASVAQGVNAPQPVVVASDSGTGTYRGKKKRKKDLVLYAVSLCVALVLVVGVVIVVNSSDNAAGDDPNSETAESNANKPDGDVRPPTDVDDKKNGKANPSDEGKPDESSPFEEVPKASDPDNTGEVTDPANETPVVPIEPVKSEERELTLNWKRSPFSKRAKLDSLALGNELGLGNFDTDLVTEPAEKNPLPNAAEHEKALTDVREALQSDFEDAVTPANKIALAQQMYEIALQESAVATKFALLTSAYELALSSAHVNASMRIADAISILFETSGNEFHANLLDNASAGLSKDAAASVASVTLMLIEKAVQAGDFELAQRLLDQATKRATDSKNPVLIQSASAISEELPVLAAQYQKTHDAIAMLEEKPDDLQATETVGRFMCFVLEDWDQGLPLLSRVDVPAIKVAAESDLATSFDPIDRVKAGDLWWDLSEQSDDSIKVALRDRAVHWYELAENQLTGLTKERIANRLNRIRETEKSDALSELSSSARALVGRYFVKSANRKSNQVTYSIWELRDDLTATADGIAVARWDAPEATRIKLTFLDSSQSPVYLRSRGPKVPMTGARTVLKETWSLEFARLTVVAVWEHKTESVKSRFGQITPESSETLTFYSNGRVNDPMGTVAWLVQGPNLAIDWGKRKKTVAVLSSDGTSYTGKTTQPTGFGRVTFSAPVNGRRISGTD